MGIRVTAWRSNCVASSERRRERLSPRAFSSKVDTGLRRENATRQRDRAPFRFNRNGKGSSRVLTPASVKGFRCRPIAGVAAGSGGRRWKASRERTRGTFGRGRAASAMEISVSPWSWEGRGEASARSSARLQASSCLPKSVGACTERAASARIGVFSPRSGKRRRCWLMTSDADRRPCRFGYMRRRS